MLSTHFVVAGLSTGNKIGLATVARDLHHLRARLVVRPAAALPELPRPLVGWYSALAVLFLIAMISAVLIFGKESEEPEAVSNPNTLTVATAPPPETTPSGGVEGDAAAGKAVFASAGCGGCHTLKAAGASGNVGPNLDELHPNFKAVHDQVEHGGGGMPAFHGQLSEQQIANVAAYVSSSAG